MTEVSLETYASLLSRSGLLSDEVIEARLHEFTTQQSSECADEEVEQEDPEHAAKRFAKFLSDAELVTDWQNNHLLRGRFRGLMFGKFRVLKADRGGRNGACVPRGR